MVTQIRRLLQTPEMINTYTNGVFISGKNSNIKDSK